MEKRNKTESINREVQLPEAIIQHIQSFLSGKEAAQTTILSKSWYSAWLTRPNLDFDQRDFEHRGHPDPKSQISDGFSEFTRRTMQRYEELKLNIQTFRLWMKWWERDWYSLAYELLVKAMNMGVTDLDFELFSGTSAFVLPQEVLESESLIRLSVTGCRIEDGKVSCSRLKCLVLHEVHLEGDLILNIMSSCPLIEISVLSECKSIVKVQSFDGVTTRKRMLALSPLLEFGKQDVGSVVVGPINLYELRTLKCLFLGKVRISTSFFSDISSKFPCLKDLTVDHCFGYKEIRVYSQSLERVSFAQNWILKANFDVPSIRKFTFSGSILPSLSSETASGEWESHISITCNHPNTSWFHKLNKLVKNLSLSRVFLSLDFEFMLEKSFDYTRDIKGLPKPVVEGLMLSLNVPFSACSGLLDGLFWSCRPEFIFQYWLPNAENGFLEILCTRLVRGARKKCSIPDRYMFGLHDLEEVNVELFEESVAEWLPLPCKTLLDASACPENERMIRFELRWGLEASTFEGSEFPFC